MRIKNVMQLHWVNRMTAFGWPPIIMMMALTLILVIGVLVGTQGEEARVGMYEGMLFNGAIFTVLGPLIGFGFVAMGSYFPLAMGLGLTRKEFSAGTSLTFLVNAAAYAVIIAIGKAIEVTTSGFGLNVRFFDVVWVGTGPVWQTLIQAFLIILAVQFVGAAIMTGQARWGQSFLWMFSIAVGVIGVAIGGAAIVSAGIRSGLWDVLTMGWGPWMGVTLGIGLLAAGAFMGLVQRAQAQ